MACIRLLAEFSYLSATVSAQAGLPGSDDSMAAFGSWLLPDAGRSGYPKTSASNFFQRLQWPKTRSADVLIESQLDLS
jgi:hypothetical protein